MHFMGLFRSVLSENVSHYGARFKKVQVAVEIKRTCLDRQAWQRRKSMKFNVKSPLLHLQFSSPGSGETKAKVGFDSDDVCVKHDEWFSGVTFKCNQRLDRQPSAGLASFTLSSTSPVSAQCVPTLDNASSQRTLTLTCQGAFAAVASGLCGKNADFGVPPFGSMESWEITLPLSSPYSYRTSSFDKPDAFQLAPAILSHQDLSGNAGKVRAFAENGINPDGVLESEVVSGRDLHVQDMCGCVAAVQHEKHQDTTWCEDDDDDDGDDGDNGDDNGDDDGNDDDGDDDDDDSDDDDGDNGDDDGDDDDGDDDGDDDVTSSLSPSPLDWKYCGHSGHVCCAYLQPGTFQDPKNYRFAVMAVRFHLTFLELAEPGDTGSPFGGPSSVSAVEAPAKATKASATLEPTLWHQELPPAQQNHEKEQVWPTGIGDPEKPIDMCEVGLFVFIGRMDAALPGMSMSKLDPEDSKSGILTSLRVTVVAASRCRPRISESVTVTGFALTKKCGNVDFARRTSCNRCGREKTTEAKMMKAGGSEIAKTLAEKSRGLFSANDWQCETCSNIDCNMCNTPKYAKLEERTGYGGGFNERENVEYIEREESDGEYAEFGRKKKKIHREGRWSCIYFKGS
ncbi:hypothetical protein GH733_002191 [Mirounga leonina]|nr:hypothetical protein GH733_002191 [Mirounga leonina]